MTIYTIGTIIKVTDHQGRERRAAIIAIDTVKEWYTVEYGYNIHAAVRITDARPV